MGGHITPRGIETKTKLIEATIKVVSEVGYTRATTRAIADAAQVAEGTIYRHFADKQQLFFAAVLNRHQVIVDWISQLPDRAGTGTVHGNLVETLNQLAGLRDDVLPLELALIADPDLARQHRRMHPLTVEPEGPIDPPLYLAKYLAAEQAHGRLRHDIDVTQSAIVLLASLFGLALLPKSQDLPVDPDLIDASVTMFVSGMEPHDKL